LELTPDEETLYLITGISKISLNGYSNKPRQTKYQKKEGSRPSRALSEARVGFADRAVEGGIPKESAKPYFPPQIPLAEKRK